MGCWVRYLKICENGNFFSFWSNHMCYFRKWLLLESRGLPFWKEKPSFSCNKKRNWNSIQRSHLRQFIYNFEKRNIRINFWYTWNIWSGWCRIIHSFSFWTKQPTTFLYNNEIIIFLSSEKWYFFHRKVPLIVPVDEPNERKVRYWCAQFSCLNTTT